MKQVTWTTFSCSIASKLIPLNLWFWKENRGGNIALSVTHHRFFLIKSTKAPRQQKWRHKQYGYLRIRVASIGFLLAGSGLLERIGVERESETSSAPFTDTR